MNLRYAVLPVLAVALTAAAPAHSDSEMLYDELVEWVISPCMEVAAALSVEEYDQETIDLGIRRSDITEVMIISREDYIRDVASKMDPDATWEARSAAYPILLKLCVTPILNE